MKARRRNRRIRRASDFGEADLLDFPNDSGIDKISDDSRVVFTLGPHLFSFKRINILFNGFQFNRLGDNA